MSGVGGIGCGVGDMGVWSGRYGGVEWEMWGCGVGDIGCVEGEVWSVEGEVWGVEGEVWGVWVFHEHCNNTITRCVAPYVRCLVYIFSTGVHSSPSGHASSNHCLPGQGRCERPQPSVGGHLHGNA